MVNPTSNAILERIHLVLGNIVHTFNITKTYADEDDSCLGILDAAESAISSTAYRLRGYIPGQLVFGRDMIFPIKHKLD